ncbi:MAG: alkaline phosphatase family protein [Candidatus Competibacteraceae bacterium]|jgi:predicted AlkP superfamily pyrophosphatase or phosphodiesterase|nr:alkaline phosphatase family protein [Candidatus Competibacteraceae bacterium]
MAGKVIMVLIDGLRFDTAIMEMGYLESAVQAGAAKRWSLQCGLPSLSRPLYETIHTGLLPHEHGILSNQTARLSNHDNLFSLVRAAGLKTAAAAYSWFSELYNGIPYDPVLDRETEDPEKAIQIGRFYTEDDMPDIEVLRDAELILRRHTPDYLLVHPMGCDYIGHLHGGESVQYRRQAALLDNLLALQMPGWLAAGYQILITSDHGFNADGWHGGTDAEVTRVPCYLFGAEAKQVIDGELSQCAVAPTVLKLLDLPIPAAMRTPPLI